MKAWLFQDYRRKNELGDACPWSVGWLDPDGKRRSKTIGSEEKAASYKAVIEDRLAHGHDGVDLRKQWKDFRQEYEKQILAGKRPRTRRVTQEALDHFEKIIKPKKISGIRTQTIDTFVAKRRKDEGLKPDTKISPATINKELRHIRAAIRVAKDWHYIAEVPRFRMIKEPKKLVRYVTPEHFAAIYKACDVAIRPALMNQSPADWWRALLVFCYMTGWRISEPLALRREDLDLVAGTAITRAADNKAGRDERVPLHPVVIEHLRRIEDFGPLVFPWPHHERTLWVDFRKIQKAAGIAGSDAYGFHDLRRAFATQNALTLTADGLQTLMRHKSYTTTQRYISMARQLDQAVQGLHVPEVLKKPRLAQSPLSV